MKNYLVLLLTIISFNLFSQIEDPVDWSFSVEQIDADIYHLIIEANIESGWNMYSQHVGPDGPVPTTFLFFESENYVLIDSVLESNSKTTFDQVFKMNLSSFQQKAIFKQKIKLLNDTLSAIKGELEFMVCDATQCLPPDYVDMIFDFKKKIKILTHYNQIW